MIDTMIDTKVLHLRTLAAALALLGGLTAPAAAQVPFAIGHSNELVAGGLLVPLQMGRDSAGNVYFGSGWYDPVTRDKVLLYRLAPDGTLTTMKDPVSDPDALAVGPDDAPYVGAYDGRILRVDPVTGRVTLWLKDLDLHNIDGLEFFGNTLYSVAFDRGEVHAIDYITKQITLLADLAPLGVAHLTGIARHPSEPRLFVSAPRTGQVIELGLDGTLVDLNFASGFDFPGHLEFDPTDPTGRTLYLADNGGGVIYSIDTQTRAVEVLVDRFDQTGGLLLDEQGRLLFTSTLDDGSRGEVWRRDVLRITIEGDWNCQSYGQLIRATVHAPADRGRVIQLLASPYDEGKPLRRGRRLPIGPKRITSLALVQTDDRGQAEFSLDGLLADPLLRGSTLYLCAVSFDPATPKRRHGISAAVAVQVPGVVDQKRN